MIDRRYRTLGAIVLSCVAAAGCAAVENTPTLERASTVAPEPPPAAPAPNPVPETASTPPAPTPPAPAAAAAQPQAQSPAVSASKPPAASPPRPASAPRAPEPTPPKPPPQVAASEPPAVAPAAPAAPNTAPAASPAGAATLDFTSLVTRLRETKAIGVLTKLSVKNQSDDLLDEFRMYHKQGAPPTLEQLHRSYDMLFLKLLSLLQDGDPPLARDIDRSRSAIWDILADPRKFIQANLMAGASP